MMKKKILELEKKLFKHEYMSDLAWLDEVICDDFKECGKSGFLFDKKDIVDELSSCDGDRKIEIYNFECQQISDDVCLAHYITRSGDSLVYRTSVWVAGDDDGYKILFHQASILNEAAELVRC